MRVLVTGGAGYIGSHTVLQLIAAGYEPLIYDNLCNSSPEAVRRISELSQRSVKHVQGNVCDAARLTQCFDAFAPEAVIHFAGLKAVGESREIPLEYYQQNVSGTVSLLRTMQAHNCPRFVLSSSATVYGEAQYLPLDEAHPVAPSNTYGRTKFFIEEITHDWCGSWGRASAAILRYFNPVGAHISGRIGEDPKGIPNNLMPLIAQVAIGKREKISVFGDDYETRDGTGERDYIHVEDLAGAHIAALAFTKKHSGSECFNVGTGKGQTVLEMINGFAKASGKYLPYEVVARRPGDVARSVACVKKAKTVLGWQAERTLQDMCETTWSWQSQNPLGYGETDSND